MRVCSNFSTILCCVPFFWLCNLRPKNRRKKHALKIWWRTFQASPDSSLTVFYPKIETCFCSFIASAGIRYEIVGRFLLFLTAAFMCNCVCVLAVPFILSLLRIVFPFLTFPNKVRAILVVRAFHVFSISVYVFGFGYRAQHIVTPPCSYNGIREKKNYIYTSSSPTSTLLLMLCVVAWIERRKKFAGFSLDFLQCNFHKCNKDKVENIFI